MFARTLAGIAVMAVAAFAADPVIGSWKLNTAKSKYTGIPMPKEMTVTYEAQGAGYKYTGKGTSGEGKPVDMSFVYVKDGAEMALTGYAFADALVLTGGKTAASSGTFKRGGKPVGAAKRTVSKDGKSMMVHASLTLPDGKKASYQAVYDRQ